MGVTAGDKAGKCGAAAERDRSYRFLELFGRYRKAIARVIARVVRPHDVEDVLQETYLRIVQAAMLRPIRHPRAFMLTTARNVALNMLGRADALNHVDASRPDPEDESTRPSAYPADSGNTPEQLAQVQEEFHLFCRAVRELPPQCRRAFVLKRIYGLSQRDIARELDITEGTVEKHLAKGLVACSAYMTARGYPRMQRPVRVQRSRQGSGGK